MGRIQGLLRGTAIAVSDGSFQDSYATAAVIIVGHSSSNCLINTVIAPGGAKDMSAYRAELTGIYSTIQLINSLCNYHGIKEGEITFGCDGESALNQALFL
jgi:hypothetical protein